MYIPDARLFMQIPLGGPTGPFDCTAWMAARLAAADSQGHVMLSGRAIRLASNEPKPDPRSPGLNLDQVDVALRRLTSPDIDLDTRIGIGTDEARRMVVSGRWMGLQVNRGVLVDAGLGGGSRFRGGHAVTVHSSDGVPVLGDSLIPYYQRTSWRTVWKAAAALVVSSNGHTVGAGHAYATFTRDVTLGYRAIVHPSKGIFYEYIVNSAGVIVDRRERHTERGFSGDCTPPRTHPWPGHGTRSIVQLKEGSFTGRWVGSVWAQEMP